MSLLDDFKRYVGDVYASTLYKNWAAANPADHTRWTTFANAIIAGQRPAAPVMATAFGKSLIDVGVEYLDGTGPPPAPPPVLQVTIVGSPQIGQTLKAAIA